MRLFFWAGSFLISIGQINWLHLLDRKVSRRTSRLAPMGIMTCVSDVGDGCVWEHSIACVGWRVCVALGGWMCICIVYRFTCCEEYSFLSKFLLLICVLCRTWKLESFEMRVEVTSLYQTLTLPLAMEHPTHPRKFHAKLPELPTEVIDSLTPRPRPLERAQSHSLRPRFAPDQRPDRPGDTNTARAMV